YWRTDGEVKKVEKYNNIHFAKLLETILFDYDGLGNRISQTVIPDGEHVTVTRYARDAQGNVLSVFETKANYEQYQNNSCYSYLVKEHHLYGSSRLGIENKSSPASLAFPKN